MSRYTIPAQDPALSIIVGWDNPLQTFFAQAFDPSVEDEAGFCRKFCSGGREGAVVPVCGRD